ncbi:hypothetical protein B4U80_12085, partial [Leptotrombidium deliense]
SNPLKEECEVQFRDWLQIGGTLTTEKVKKYFSDFEIVKFVSESHPAASLQQILFAAKVTALGVYADDFFDDRCGIESIMETVEKFKAFERGEKIEPENLFEVLVKDIYSESLAILDENQRTSLRRKCYYYVKSVQWQNKLKRRKRIPEIGEYMSLRAFSVTNDVSLELYEFIAGINLPLHVKCDQSIMNMNFLANQIVLIMNDLASLEADVNSDFPANLVMSVKHTRKCTWQEAADEVHQTFLESIDEFKCWEKLVTKFYDQEIDSKVNEYIFLLKNFVNANIHLHYNTKHYSFKSEHVLKLE